MSVETKYEYGVEHVTSDGWSDITVHRSRATAERDYATCGMFCAVVKRIPGSAWMAA